ncbi:hypothetical protein HDV06_005113 [Boothiomyces sp. JEL0866]|nr:hypothetical protein HDV06_005113 [Boothiomyces sp. JEL0866]
MVNCQFFSTSQGCQFGAMCRFAHVNPQPQEQEQSRPKSSSKRQKEKQETVTIKPGLVITKKKSTIQEDISVLDAMNELKVQPAKPARPVVSRPVSKTILQSSDPVERARNIRDFEIQQLAKRYSAKTTTFTSHIAVEFEMHPSDPDFPFELESLQVLLTIPILYPTDRKCKLNLNNPEIPVNLSSKIEKTVSEKIEMSRLTLLDIMKWMDKELESFLVDKPDAGVKIAFVKPTDARVYYGGESGSSDEEQQEEELSDETGDELEESEEPSLQMPEISHKGTQIRLINIDLENISLLHSISLSISVKCDRCKEVGEFLELKPSFDSENIQTHSCHKCSTVYTANFRTDFVHMNSISLGFLDLEGCSVLDLLPSKYSATCSNCNHEQAANECFQNLVRNSTTIQHCRNCHTKLTITLNNVKFVKIDNTPVKLLRKAPRKPKDEHFTINQPLPKNGMCSHYRKSYRWFRFPCCSKLYPCDVCHDEAADHNAEWANRMICGFCSREQPYSQKPCVCGKSLVREKGKGFWEGGDGTRDPRLMSKNDSRKYAGMNKTMSRKSKDKKFGRNAERLIPIYDFESYQATAALLKSYLDPSELLILDNDYLNQDSFMYIVSHGHIKEFKRLLQTASIDTFLKRLAITHFLDESKEFYPTMVLDLLATASPTEFNFKEYYTPMLHRTIVYGTLDNVKEYIEKYHVDPSDSDSFSFRVACTKGREDIAEYLFHDRRVDPSADNNYSLRWTSSSGNVFLTKLLLTDIRVDPTVDSNYPIRMASSTGNTDLVEIFLADPRVNPFDEDNYAIRWAASNGHLGVVRLLVKEGRVDPSAANNFSILASSNNGHADVVDYLLQDHRVDPSANGNYAIRFASENGHFSVVERLLKDSRVSPEAEYNHAVRIACRKGFLSIVQLLMTDSRVDPSAEQDYAIKWAAQNGHLQIVKLLLQHPLVNPATGNNHAINVASKNGHYEIVSLLFADPRVNPAQDNNYAIRFACKNGHLKVVQLLLTDEQVRENINTNYAEALRWAAQNGHLAILEELLSKTTVEPQVLDNFALKACAQYGHVKVLELLLKDPRCDPTADQNNAIRMATDNGHLDVVKILLADPRVDPTDDDNYAIYAAARSGYLEIVRALLADSRLSTFVNYEEAVRHARINGHQSVVNELEDRYLDLLPRVVTYYEDESEKKDEIATSEILGASIPHEVDDLTLNNDISNLANLSESFLHIDGELSEEEMNVSKELDILNEDEPVLEPKLSVTKKTPLEFEGVIDENRSLEDEIMATIAQNLSSSNQDIVLENNESVTNAAQESNNTKLNEETIPRFVISQDPSPDPETITTEDSNKIAESQQDYQEQESTDNAPRFLIDSKSEEAIAGSIDHDENFSADPSDQPRYFVQAESEQPELEKDEVLDDQTPRFIVE